MTKLVKYSLDENISQLIFSSTYEKKIQNIIIDILFLH